ncbi:hypothetical protein [Bacteroides fragilis]|uniref:hypothetical protein n=1 Tax=Bacteroides fragilis TaxID=817 RepID=UPI002456586F|nr:hypothetical protein [Bacteroides fragilis]
MKREGKEKRGTHYYNIEGKEERRKEDQEDKKGKRGIRTDGKTKLIQGILLLPEALVRDQAKT